MRSVPSTVTRETGITKVIRGTVMAKDPQSPEEEGEGRVSAGTMGSVPATHTAPLSIGVQGVEENIRE